MTAVRFFLLTCILAGLAPTGAAARCEGAVMLGTLHDAYRALLTEDGPQQRQGAMTLLFISGGQSSHAFARQVSHSGIEVSEERIGAILADAEAIASMTLRSGRPKDVEFRHGQNVQWLADTFAATRCQNSRATTSQSAVFASETSTGTAARRTVEDTKGFHTLDSIYKFSAVLALLTGLAYGAYRFQRSFVMRRRRVQRMPRTPVSIPLKISFPFPDGAMQEVDVSAVDISVGGMKVSWPDPPSPKTHVTLVLAETTRVAQVMWSNSFFAGLMFENPLSADELQSYMSDAREKAS